MTAKRARKGKGSIYADVKRGLYVGEITIRGKRHRVYGPTKVATRDRLNALINGDDEHLPAAELPDGPNLRQLLEEWLRRDVSGRDVAPATVVAHRWAADHITSVAGHLNVASLTVAEVESALEVLHTDTGMSRASFVKVRSSWRQALQYAARRGVVTSNVAADALLPAGAARRVARRSLEPDEARTLLAVLRTTPDGLLFGLSLRLGLRPGEAAALQWRDIDLDRGVLSVNRSRQLDGRGRPVIVDDLKVESARRTLGMPADVIDWLREHRASSGRLPTAEALLFGGPSYPSTDRAALDDLCTTAQVPRIRPNELRHSCASLLIDEGAPIERVADLLGHNSTRMVDLVYRHRVRPSIDTAVSSDWTVAR